MKYIILEMEDGRRLPIIFPDCLIHADIAGAIQMAVDVMDPKKDLRAKQCASMLERASAVPVSAGFIALGTDFVCSGSSETLELASRPQDEALIGIGEQAWAFPDAQITELWDKAKAHKESQRGVAAG